MTFEAYPDNMEFARRHYLKKGDIVSFKHRGFLASAKPKFPTIHRIRSDLTWDDVVNNWNEHKHASKGNSQFSFSGVHVNNLSIFQKLCLWMQKVEQGRDEEGGGRRTKWNSSCWIMPNGRDSILCMLKIGKESPWPTSVHMRYHIYYYFLF